MSSPQGVLSIPQMLKISPEQFNLWQLLCDLRVAMPGIVQSFDAVKQTVVVRPALKEKIFKNRVRVDWAIPDLLDVPIVIPRAGAFSLTLPVQSGDECLIVFADMCIDAWFQSGQVQNQMERRRHDLSDAIAVLGLWSQPRVIPNYSTTSAQLRNSDASVVIDVQPTQVVVQAPTVTVNATQTATVSGANVNVTASQRVTVSGSQHTKIDNKDFLLHTHSDPQGGITGPVS